VNLSESAAESWSKKKAGPREPGWHALNLYMGHSSSVLKVQSQIDPNKYSHEI